MRILWFNWRCIKHPLAGGAEVYTHEVAKRLVNMGNEVILVTSRPNGLSKEEIIDGYKVIRRGGKYTVYSNARKLYQELRKAGWKPDVIVDEVNTIPFFTPKYVSEPIYMLIHQLCKECWKYVFNPIIQPFGWWLEKRFHRLYIDGLKDGRVKGVITVSQSTKNDLIELGYPEERIFIIYNGLDWGAYKDCKKLASKKESIVLYLGRITPYKRIEDILKAWKYVEKMSQEAYLIIAGRADKKYLGKLIKLSKKLQLKNIEFRTDISQYEKKLLLAKASVLVYSSIKEGWGQTVLEAAACYTPAVAYNVSGLKDSISHMQTGILVTPNDIIELANSILTIISDVKLRDALGNNAYKSIQKYSWERTTDDFIKTIYNDLMTDITS